MARNPTFPFFYSDWLGSTTLALMTCSEAGAYVYLLCHQWGDPQCSLPTDDRSLAVLSRLGPDWLASAAMLRPCFPPHPEVPGRLANAKLLEAWISRQEWAAKSSQAGKRSAKARRAKRQAPPQQNTNQIPTKSQPTMEAPPQPEPNQHATKVQVSSSSFLSSSLSSSATNSTTAKEEKDCAEKRGASTWLTPFAEVWNLSYGGELPFGEAGKALKKLVAQHGESEVITRFGRYCSETPGQYASVHKFKQTFGVWNGNGNGNKLMALRGNQTAGEKTSANVKAFLEGIK